MRPLLFIGAALTALSLGTAAQASCFFNKAICQAICSKDCCDNWNLAAPADPRGLRQISVDDLKAELEGRRATRKTRAFMSAVQAELKARGMPAGSSTLAN